VLPALLAAALVVVLGTSAPAVDIPQFPAEGGETATPSGATPDAAASGDQTDDQTDDQADDETASNPQAEAEAAGEESPFDGEVVLDQEGGAVAAEPGEDEGAAASAAATNAADSDAAGRPLDAEDLGAFFGGSSEELAVEEEVWPKSDSEQLVDGIAAQVGSGVVLISEVVRIAAPVEERMRKAGVPESEVRRMRSEALDRLIETRLIEDVVQRAQLSATDAEVNQAIAAIASENGLTVEQMGASIASHGLTIEEYRAKIKTEIERNKVVGSMVRSRVHVEESDVEALYQQRYGNQRESGVELHIAHILIATGAKQMRDERSACALATKLRSEIVSGETTFAAAAQDYSDTNADRGGDLGWVHDDELAAWMAPAVSGLKPGQVSEVVPMYFGCNLLELVDRREVKPVTLDEVRPELQEIVFRQKMEVEYGLWIEKLRETVYVERKGIYAEAERLGDQSATR